MLIANTLLVLLSVSTPNHQQEGLTALINNLGTQVAWTSSNRTESLSKDQAINRLQKLVADHPEFEVELKHQSEWKNGKCYRVIQLTTNKDTYRIFYYCEQRGSQEVVAKIKVSTM